MTRSHYCRIGLGSDSLIPKEKGFWGKFTRKWRKLGLVSQHHPSTYEHFYSYPSVLAEGQRQLYESGGFLSHPFSIFRHRPWTVLGNSLLKEMMLNVHTFSMRATEAVALGASLVWKSFMVVVNLTHISLSTFRLFFIIDPRYHRSTHACDHALLALHILCWADILVQFNMGIVEQDEQGSVIVLNRMHIASNYLKKWFVLDFVSSLPIAYILLKFGASPHHLLFAHLFPLLRTSRVYTVVTDLTNFVKMFKPSYVWYGGIRQAVLFVLTIHWCSCLIYLPTVHSLYWHGKVFKEHHRFFSAYSAGSENILEISVAKRYSKSLFIAVSGSFGTGYSMFLASEPDEILLHSIIILYSAMFMIYNFVFLFKVYITIYGPTVRYHEVINQIEEYMRFKQFPAPLKKKVKEFYYYRYQEHYYSEDAVLGSLSDELRHEILFHTCHKLVGLVGLFNAVSPSVVGSVLGCLHNEVYLPNDSVMRAGEIGDYMYFVASGTVAVYSLKGVEVCHLEDGAHFGEVALLMKDRKRTATAVAVETTQLYRLNYKDFQKFVMSNKLLYERITALASKRMHETVLLDEQFRRNWEQLQEKQRTTST